jgi:hypothetical protein
MTPDDLRRSAEVVVAALHPVRYDDWSVPAGDLDWDCRATLEHLLDTLMLYAAHLATRADRGLPYLRHGDPQAPVRHLVRTITSAAGVLAAVVEAAPPATRAFHPVGASDPEGFCAMGCDELLVHAHDIAAGLGVPFRAPDEVAAAVVRRLFPWAPGDEDPWATLLWANGRHRLGGRRLPADWTWQSAPAGDGPDQA